MKKIKDMDNRFTVEIAKSLKGKRVRIKGSHPWAGSTGTVGNYQQPAGINKVGILINLENQSVAGCFVFEKNLIEVID